MKEVENKRQGKEQAEHWKHEFEKRLTLGVKIRLNFSVVVCFNPSHRDRVRELAKMRLRKLISAQEKLVLLWCICIHTALHVDVYPFSLSEPLRKKKVR